jgi:hypothetical protein
MSSPATSSESVQRTSRWDVLLVAVWAALAIRIGLAITRGESLRDDLALPSVFLFIDTAILGSRLWSMALARRDRG